MNNASLKLKELARLLVAHEASSNRTGSTKNSEPFRVCKKLRVPLSRLTGIAGFRSLLSRALTLASAEVTWLRTLHVNADGSLEGLEKIDTELEPDTMAEGEVVLVAQVIGLLVTFIGPTLTQQLLHDIWPKLDDLNV